MEGGGGAGGRSSPKSVSNVAVRRRSGQQPEAVLKHGSEGGGVLDCVDMCVGEPPPAAGGGGPREAGLRAPRPLRPARTSRAGAARPGAPPLSQLQLRRSAERGAGGIRSRSQGTPAPESLVAGPGRAFCSRRTCPPKRRTRARRYGDRGWVAVHTHMTFPSVGGGMRRGDQVLKRRMPSHFCRARSAPTALRCPFRAGDAGRGRGRPRGAAPPPARISGVNAAPVCAAPGAGPARAPCAAGRGGGERGGGGRPRGGTAAQPQRARRGARHPLRGRRAAR